MLVDIANNINLFDFIEMLTENDYIFKQNNKGKNTIIKKEVKLEPKKCVCGATADIEVQGMYFCSNCYNW